MRSQKKTFKNMSIATGTDGIVTPFHPGAEKFWREKGRPEVGNDTARLSRPYRSTGHEAAWPVLRTRGRSRALGEPASGGQEGWTCTRT